MSDDNQSPLPHLTPEQDKRCDRFEAAWKAAGTANTPPRIEEHLGDALGAGRLALLHELVALDLVYRRSRGETPHAEEYLGRFPELRSKWLAEELARTPEPGDTTPTGEVAEPRRLRCPTCHNPITLADDPGDEVLCPGCGGGFRVRDARLTDTKSTSRPLGKFQLLERVGQGAFGAVWKARDTVLSRVVALKIPHTGLLIEAEELERFHREARAAAQLRHPGIVAVHEVLTLEGLPTIVSDFVQGVTLKDFLEVRKLTFRESAALVAHLAEALDYAHGMGLVHRDIKPANVMLESRRVEDEPNEEGLGRPLLMDFGLALRGEAEVTMTIDGHIIGTPAYMSPEQAAGRSHQADRRSDVYSLGVVLYELLTGELPFRGSAAMMMSQVLSEEPRPLRKLNEKIPRDLETVCLKCLQKEPSRRYETARELTDDLRRWAEDEPIKARPVGWLEQAARWVRRRPTAAGLLGMTGLALTVLVGAVVGLFSHIEIKAAYQTAEGARIVAESARRDEAVQRQKTEAALALADRIGYIHSIHLADAALRKNDVPLALQRLGECKPEFQDWEWRYLNAQCHSELFSIPGKRAAFSRDGNRLAVWGRDGLIRTYDAWTGTVLCQQGRGVWAVDPELVTVAVPNGFDTLRVVNADTGAVVSQFDQVNLFHGQEFSPDGTLVAVLTLPGTEEKNGLSELRVHAVRTGERLCELKGVRQHAFTLFSPDSNRILVIERGGQNWGSHLGLYEARTGKECFPGVGGDDVWTGAFSPDGLCIAIARRDGAVQLYDARTGLKNLQIKGPHNHRIPPVFSHDGASLITWRGDVDWRVGDPVRVWDIKTGAERPLVEGPKVHDLALSPDGTQFAVRTAEGVRILDAKTGAEWFWLIGSRDNSKVSPLDRSNPLAPKFSPDGSRIATICEDGLVRVYDARNGPWPNGPRAGVLGAAFSPDASCMAILGTEGVKVIDCWTGAEVLQLNGLSSYRAPQFSPDGSQIAIVHEQQLHGGNGTRAVRVFQLKTGAETLRVSGGKFVGKVEFSPNGACLAIGGDGKVRVYEIRTGKQLFQLNQGQREHISLYSPDGTLIALEESEAAGQKRGVRLYDGENGKAVRWLEGDTSLLTPVFSPSSDHIAARARDEVRLYHTRTEKEVARFNYGHLSPAFSPDGTRIAVVGKDRTVRLYQTRTEAESLRLEGSKADWTPAFSRDGSCIVVLERNAGARIYNTLTGSEVSTIKLPISGYHATFTRDGTRLFMEGRDAVLRLFDVQSGKQVLALPGNTENWRPPVVSPDGLKVAVVRHNQLLNYCTPSDTTAWQLQRRSALQNGVQAWHRSRAVECEKAGQSFAAAFHVERLAQLNPSDTKTRAKAMRAWLQANQPERAALHVGALALHPFAFPGSEEQVRTAFDTGLRAELYAGMAFDRLIAIRLDQQLSWAGTEQGPHLTLPAERFSIRWTGSLKAPTPWNYTLLFFADDGVRLWLDGRKVIDAWKAPQVATHRCEVRLTDRPHQLKIEYFQNQGSSGYKFSWIPPRALEATLVPADCLSPPKHLATSEKSFTGR